MKPECCKWTLCGTVRLVLPALSFALRITTTDLIKINMSTDARVSLSERGHRPWKTQPVILAASQFPFPAVQDQAHSCCDKWFHSQSANSHLFCVFFCFIGIQERPGRLMLFFVQVSSGVSYHFSRWDVRFDQDQAHDTRGGGDGSSSNVCPGSQVCLAASRFLFPVVQDQAHSCCDKGFSSQSINSHLFFFVQVGFISF